MKVMINLYAKLLNAIFRCHSNFTYTWFLSRGLVTPRSIGKRLWCGRRHQKVAGCPTFCAVGQSHPPPLIVPTRRRTFED